MTSEQSYLDEDGYPTQAALTLIQEWDAADPRNWFNFIQELWHMRDWGWRECDEAHEYRAGVTAHRYYISTAGWSGNESIIRAMQANDMLWHTQWVQSRRGGHYIFELKEFA